jgi:putative transposase
MNGASDDEFESGRKSERGIALAGAPFCFSAAFSAVFHDDQGSQYTSRAFQRCLESHGIAQSMSRPGNPWDNAVAESFFKTLKRELINDRRYKSRDEARQEVFKYIELYYNRQRLHSKNGYMAPCDLERDAA